MIAFLLVFAVVLYLVQKYSLEHVLDEVSFKTSMDKALVEPGETFRWTMTIKNEKRWMVPYLKVKEQVPEGLLFEADQMPVEEEGRKGLSSTLYLAGRQQMELDRRVTLVKRGRHFFRGAQVEAGDFLGIRSVSENYPELEEVVVKPRPWKKENLPVLLGGYLGEYAADRSLLEDPILIRGFREYTGREPFRAISWTQSARHEKLLVREYERAADVSCTVLLNTWIGEKKEQTEILETCFSMVRSVCEELERRKIPYDFRTNGIISGAMGSWSRVEEGLGPGHLEAVLEGLGRMTYDSRESEEEFLQKAFRQIRNGKGLILVTPEQDAQTGQAKLLADRQGQHLLILTAMEMEG